MSQFPSWHFREMGRGEVNVDPVHDEFFKAQDLTDALVREAVQNSLDALKSKAFENEKPVIWIESRVEPGKSVLVIRDNGRGFVLMPSAAAKRGWGLTGIRERVRLLGAIAEIHAEPDRGTTDRVERELPGKC